MLFARRIKILNPQFCKKLKKFSTRTQPSTAIGEEYTEKPMYPEILDTSYKARKHRKTIAWHDKIKNLKIVEEKLLELNMPKYYGYKTTLLSDNDLPYNCKQLTQHYTRTHFEEVDNLPEFYKLNDVDSFVKSVQSAIEDAIIFADISFRQKYGVDEEISPEQRDKYMGAAIVDAMNRTIISSLSADYPHLTDVEVDLDPRHEAFWFVGGIYPPESVRKMREGIDWQKDFIDDPVDRATQYMGVPYLAVRHRHPLKPTVDDVTAGKEFAKKVPVYTFDPRTIGYKTTYRHGTTIPGYWPGSPQEFGLLSYQRREHMVTRNPRFGTEDNQEALHSQGMQSSFAWLFGQACYQGFSTFNDITYPLSTQTVITNGKLFSFYVYQMNTTLVHSNMIYENPKVNLCWGTKELQLYDSIDENGKIVGFNPDVLRNLIHFYVNVPEERINTEMKPYLGKDEQKIADIEHDGRREFLERVYKHMVSNRPRHRKLPEIEMWERIYKIDNKTRSLDKKERFFEFGINPFQRRMDEHAPTYIPKILRPEDKKHKARFEKTYYP